MVFGANYPNEICRIHSAGTRGNVRTHVTTVGHARSNQPRTRDVLFWVYGIIIVSLAGRGGSGFSSTDRRSSLSRVTIVISCTANLLDLITGLSLR
jgi:hypothetical protein